MLSSAQETVANRGSFVLTATSSDRELAAQLASVIDTPPPIKTFLSFARDGVFPELVDICVCVIPPEQWVLLPDDLEVIRALPQNEDTSEIQQKAIVDSPSSLFSPLPNRLLQSSALSHSSRSRLPNLIRRSGRPSQQPLPT